MTRAIGIDVGATNTRACVCDTASGALLTRERALTHAEDGGAAVLARSTAIAERLGGGEALPLGLALCELVDPEGRPASAESIDWRGLDLPGVLESDVRAAALAEARFGAGRGSRHFVYVTAGTGIAHTLVIDGRPMPGAHGAALILGAPPVERLASGRALGGDPGRVEEAGAALGHALAFLAHALDPERIVLGGGLGRDLAYRGAVEAGLRRWLEPPAHTAVPLVPARLGVDAGCIGAALYALGG